MRQHLVGAAIAAFAAMAVPAAAADMAVKALPPPAPIFNWTGFYIGGEVGGLWGQADGTLIFPPVAHIQTETPPGSAAASSASSINGTNWCSA